MSYYGGTESVTVYGGSDISDQNYGMDEMSNSPGYPSWLNSGADANAPWSMYSGPLNDTSAVYDWNNIGTTFTPNYFLNMSPAPSPPPGGDSGLPVESVTVTAYAPQPQDVQEPDPSNFSFDFSNIDPGFSPNYFGNLAAADNVESVTVEATREPEPQQVQAPVIPYNWIPVQWDPSILWPDLPDDVPAKPVPKKAPPRKTSGGGTVGGAGAGIAPPQKPQQPLQQLFNIPPGLTAAQLAAILAAQRSAQAAPGRVTPQQLSALDQLSPAQLAQLLKSGQLTPAQSQAVQQALAKKLAAPVSAGGGGMTPAAAQRAAAAAASPFQTKAAILPAIMVGGLMAAYAVTHRQAISKKVQVAYKSASRRVRRVLA